MINSLFKITVKFWKRILLAVFGVSVALAAPAVLPDKVDEAGLKIPRENIQYFQQYKNEKGQDEIIYWIPGDEEAPFEAGEVRELRTPRRKVVDLGDGKYSTEVYLEPLWIEEGGDWKKAEIATTTQVTFDKVSFWHWIKKVFAADTGFKVTGTVEAAGSWSGFNTTRLNTSNNSRATCGGTGCSLSSSDGEMSDFSFGIPGGATIDGIEASAEWSCTNGASCPFLLSTLDVGLSWDDGSTYTTFKTASTQSQTDITTTYGGAADTWGRSWTDTELANGTFRAAVRNTSSTGTTGIDLFQIKVYYTTGGGAASTLVPHLQFFEE